MYTIIKKIFDEFISIVAIIVLIPLFLIIMILVYFTSPGNIFYMHKRVGKNGKYFNVIKFRTMKSDSRPLNEIFTEDQYSEYLKVYKLKNDPRITKVGKFLRKTSLDELPQLFNIALGNMSIVGPRPITKEEITRLSDVQKREYLSVLPGLTGYWAVHGRSKTSYKERIDLELFYVHHQSFWLDNKIVFQTFFKFFVDSE